MCVYRDRNLVPPVLLLIGHERRWLSYKCQVLATFIFLSLKFLTVSRRFLKALGVDNSSHPFPSMNLWNSNGADELIQLTETPPCILSHFFPYHRKPGRESYSNSEEQRQFMGGGGISYITLHKVFLFFFLEDCNQDTEMHNGCSEWISLCR